MAQALAGDPVAAKACAAPHLKGDQNLLRYWIQIAAENGDAVSQYNFAIILLNRNIGHDKARAIFWLKKSSGNGIEPAKQVLDDIRRNPNSTIPFAPPPPDIGK